MHCTCMHTLTRSVEERVVLHFILADFLRLGFLVGGGEPLVSWLVSDGEGGLCRVASSFSPTLEATLSGLEVWPEFMDVSNSATSKSVSPNITGESPGGVSGIGGVALGGSGRVVIPGRCLGDTAFEG